jgi:hypothetical protein
MTPIIISKRSWYYSLLALVGLCALLLVPQSKFLHDNWRITIMRPSDNDVAVMVHNDDNAVDNAVNDSITEQQEQEQEQEQLQGQRGRWIQDWEYAKRTSYPNHGSYSDWHIAAQQFRPTPQQPFRLATSWYWHDEHRPLHLIDKAGFCNVSQSLNITRILILGDSLSIEFHRSLLSLLGHGPNHPKASRFQAIFQPTIVSCPSNGHNNGNIIVKLERMSPISDWLKLDRQVHIKRFVQENPHNTLVVANLGTWIQTMNDYQDGLHALLQWIDSVVLPSSPTSKRVIPFFRPTIPGHPNCQPKNQQRNNTENYYNWSIPVEEAPWDSYVDFKVHFNHWNTLNQLQPTKNITFQWDQFEEYNEYTKQQIFSGSYNTTWHWLNVYNSTVLRRDGHIGFQDCLRKFFKNTHQGSTTEYIYMPCRVASFFGSHKHMY